MTSGASCVVQLGSNIDSRRLRDTKINKNAKQNRSSVNILLIQQLRQI